MLREDHFIIHIGFRILFYRPCIISFLSSFLSFSFFSTRSSSSSYFFSSFLSLSLSLCFPLSFKRMNYLYKNWTHVRFLLTEVYLIKIEFSFVLMVSFSREQLLYETKIVIRLDSYYMANGLKSKTTRIEKSSLFSEEEKLFLTIISQRQWKVNQELLNAKEMSKIKSDSSGQYITHSRLSHKRKKWM